MASVVLIQGIATADGLRAGLAAAGGGANVLLERDGISQPGAYDAFQVDAAGRVGVALGAAVTAGAQFARSSAMVVATIDGVPQGPPVTWNPAVVAYRALSDHVHVVAGRWPSDAKVGSDWPITVSARATDDLGTPLNMAVGSEYCFNYVVPGRRHAPESWCARVAATWLPNDVTDPYWAGHVPETDVSTGHNSFFQVLARMPDAVGSAEQQYVPDLAHVTAVGADGVVQGVNQLRGHYGVSGNDVFVSGLDATISAFLVRQSAAAGPMLVTAVGLLVVALAALAFAAVQFIEGQVAQAALWRARGWPRRRVWLMFVLEFALLGLVAAPIAVFGAALAGAFVNGSTSAGMTFGWQAIADAVPPSLLAIGAFLVVLGLIALALSAMEVTRRGDGNAAAPARSWRRRTIDVVLALMGVALLAFVHSGGADPSGGAAQSNPAVLALPIVAVGLLAFASRRLVGVVARTLTATRSLGGRLARWQVERDPGQYARLCLLVTLAVTVGVFASTYTTSERVSALDRADYGVGADVRAVFSSAASPPPLDSLAASLPGSVTASQVFRGVGRPGRSGDDAVILGVQGRQFWNLAYSRSDFASQPLATLTAQMNAGDPDGIAVPGSARGLVISVYSSGLDAHLEVEVSDSGGDDTLLSLGAVGPPGWKDLTAPLPATPPLSPPLRVRALQVVPFGANATGDVAVQDLRTDAGAVLEHFTAADGWWQENFAPDTLVAPLTPGMTRTHVGRPAADVPVDHQAIVLQPPQAAKPLPVLLASQTMAALGLSVGQPFPLHIDTVDVQLVAVGSFDDFPTYYPGRGMFMVVPMTSFTARLGHEGASSPWPNELWTTSGGDSAAVTARLQTDPNLLTALRRTDAETLALNDPLRLGLRDELGLGFIIALGVVVIGFALHFLAAARNRTTQFAIMRANGVPSSVLRGALLAEQAVVILAALVAGAVIGLALSWSVTPLFHLGTLPEDLTPASVFALDPLTLLVIVAGTGALALLVGALVARTAARVDIMAAVRSLA